MNDRQAPDIELDDEAEALLAAFRGEEEIPGDLHDRVWTRVEVDTAPEDRVVVGPWVRRVAIGVVAAAAAVALAWISTDSLDATKEDQAAMQAPHGALIERTSGEAAEAKAQPPVEKRKPVATDVPVPVPMPVPEAVEPEPSVEPEPNPTKPSTKAPKPQKKVEAPVAVEPSTLGEEVTLIQKARKALLAKTPREALTILRDHADRFPNGAMVQERRALLAIATCEANGPDAGRASAESFLSKHPKAALADRVRSACGVQ